MTSAMMLALALLPIEASATGHPWLRTKLLDLARAMEAPEARYGTLSFAVTARGDEVVTGGLVLLDLAGSPQDEEFVVRLNGDTAGRCTTMAHATTCRVELDADAFTQDDRLEVVGPRSREEDREAQRWRNLLALRVELRGHRLPMADDLSLLPFPFVDPTDEAPSLHIVFASPPTPATAGAAALLAAWLAARSPSRLALDVTLGTPPDEHAILLVDGANAARGLGLPPPRSASLGFSTGGRGQKQLVLEATTPEQLLEAARMLARIQSVGARPRMALDRAGRDIEAQPPAVPTRPPPMALLATGSGPRRFDANQGAVLDIPIQLAPDLFTWPARNIAAEVIVRESVASDPSSAIDVSFNGQHVGAVPPGSAAMRARSARIEIPATLLQPLSVLQLYIPREEANTATGAWDRFVEVDGASHLRLEGAIRWSPAADIAAFVETGYPFTAQPDLGSTAVLLPASPSLDEVRALLSAFAAWARGTGVVGWRADFRSELGPRRDRDLLILGHTDELPAFHQATPSAPVSFLPRPAPAEPGTLGWIELALSGPRRWRARLDATARMPHAPLATTIAAWRTPATGRNIVAWTAPAGIDLAALPSLEATPVADGRAGDVLLVGDGRPRRWQLGPDATLSADHPILSSAYWLSRHPVALVLLTASIAVLGSRSWRQATARTAKARINAGRNA